MIFALAVALHLVADTDVPSSDEEFTYYLTEYIQHELPPGDPMGQLIADRLVASVFNTTNEATFTGHIRQLKAAAKNSPDKIERFVSLDSRLEITFNEKLQAAKHKRMLYAAGGAVVGAIVGLPVGKLLSTSTAMGTKILFLTVPVGALTGAGAGYLLADLIAMPAYSYEPGTMTRDLGLINSDPENLN